MKFTKSLTTKRVVLGCLCAGTLAVVACADGSAALTGPSATSIAASSTLASAPRTGELHVMKECSSYAGQAGDFCTITSSNVDAIEVGSRVIYA